MKLLNLKNVGLSFLLFGAVQTPALSINIDLFQEGAQSLTLTGNGTTSGTSTGLGSSVIGGSRSLTLTVTNQVNSYDTKLSINTTNQQALLDTFRGKSSTIFKWDGNGSGLGGLDLTESGIHDSIALQNDFNDQDLNVTFTVVDNASTPNTSSLTMPIPKDSDGTIFYFKHSDFTGGSVDFSNVKSITMTTSPTSAIDYGFSFVQSAQAVPFEFSPALGILLSGGFFGFTFLKKKFQKKIEI